MTNGPNTDFDVVRLEERGEAAGQPYAVYKVIGGPPDMPDIPEGERDLDLFVTDLFLAQMRKEITEVSTGQEKPAAIILDMSPLVFVDSAGMQALIAIRSWIGHERFYVAQMQRAPKRVFEIMALAAHIRTAGSVQEAVLNLSQ